MRGCATSKTSMRYTKRLAFEDALMLNTRKGKCILTAGCRATIAKRKAKIRVMTIKKVLSPQSCPDGVNQ